MPTSTRTKTDNTIAKLSFLGRPYTVQTSRFPHQHTQCLQGDPPPPLVKLWSSPGGGTGEAVPAGRRQQLMLAAIPAASNRM